MLWVLNKKPDRFGRLLCWDVGAGKKLHDFQIGYELPFITSLWFVGGTRCLQWVPDGSGWLLFGHLLVDAQSGAVTGRIPPEPKFSGGMINRRFLSSDLVTSIERKQFTIERLNRRSRD
jgi:hypothetical protein